MARQAQAALTKLPQQSRASRHKRALIVSVIAVGLSLALVSHVSGLD
jgi:hypothetical protein